MDRLCKKIEDLAVEVEMGIRTVFLGQLIVDEEYKYLVPALEGSKRKIREIRRFGRTFLVC